MAKHWQAKFLSLPHFSKSILLKTADIHFILIFSFFLFSNNLAGQIVRESIDDGSWNSTSTWEGGVIPTSPDYATINDTVTIKSGTTVEVDSLTISDSGNLVVEGTLIIYGGLNMADNGSELITDSLANVFIFGNASLANKVSINLASYFVVLGDFTKAGSHNQGELTINNAHIYIFGTVDIPEKPDAWQNFSVCSSGYYGGTTATENDDCDAGQLDDFISNVPPEDLPDGIYDQLVGCDPPTTTISGEAEVCLGELAAYLTLSSVTGDKYTINFDTAAKSQGFDDVSGVSLSDGEIEITVPEIAKPDTYNANLTVSNSATGCTSEIYNISIIIHPLPATGKIIPD